MVAWVTLYHFYNECSVWVLIFDTNQICHKKFCISIWTAGWYIDSCFLLMFSIFECTYLFSFIPLLWILILIQKEYLRISTLNNIHLYSSLQNGTKISQMIVTFKEYPAFKVQFPNGSRLLLQMTNRDSLG